MILYVIFPVYLFNHSLLTFLIAVQLTHGTLVSGVQHLLIIEDILENVILFIIKSVKGSVVSIVHISSFIFTLLIQFHYLK